MLARADRLVGSADKVRQKDRVAHISFPTPAPCGKTPLQATGLTKTYGSLEVFAGVDLAVDKQSRVVVLGFNGAGKPPCCDSWRGRSTPTGRAAS